MKKAITIFDAQGNPTDLGDEHQDPNLPSGVQALIETRVNAAISDIREHNRDDLQDLARDQTRKWRYLALISLAFGLISTAFTVVTLFIAPKEAVEWIGGQIDKKLTEPMIRASADRLINDKMALYVEDQLKPLSKQTVALESRIQETEKNIAAKQSVLAFQQEALAAQLGISELAVSAKAGSRQAFTSLMAMKHSASTNDFLKATIRELELFYDAERNKDTYDILVVTETLADPGFSSDELVQAMVNDPEYCEEAAINSLGKSKAKATVRELCRKAEESKNLHAAARTTWALQEITGQKFRPLAFDAVAKWWERNQTNAAYNGSYTGYFNVVKTMYAPSFSMQKAEKCVEQLGDTVATDPDALHARCLKAAFLLMLGKDDEARTLLNEVRGKRSDYYWLYVWDAAAQLKTNNTDKAIELVNKAFEKSPTSVVEMNLKLWNIFAPIHDSERVNWPSKKIKDAPP